MIDDDGVEIDVLPGVTYQNRGSGVYGYVASVDDAFLGGIRFVNSDESVIVDTDITAAESGGSGDSSDIVQIEELDIEIVEEDA